MRQCDVLKLAQKAEFVVNRQALFLHPMPGFAQPALGHPHLRLQGAQRTHFGDGRAAKVAFCRTQLVKRTGQGARALFEACLGATETIAPIG